MMMDGRDIFETCKFGFIKAVSPNGTAFITDVMLRRSLWKKVDKFSVE